MKNLKMLIFFSLTILFLSLFAAGSIKAFAAEKMKAVSVKRITPPDYRPSNIFYGVRDWGVWSKNNDKILLFEGTAYVHPISGKRGRGLVWGTVANFESWTNTADYERKIVPLPSVIQTGTAQRTDPSGVIWSMYDNDIIYVLRENGWLVKVNTANNMAITNVIQYDPNGLYKNAMIAGWTKDGRLFIELEYDNWAIAPIEIDVLAPKIIASAYIWNPCDSRFARLPDISHGHSGRSPNGNLYYQYAGDGSSNGTSKEIVTNGTTCQSVHDNGYLNKSESIYPWSPSHISWKSSNDWLLMNSFGPVTVTEPQPAPNKQTFKLWQVLFDGTNFTYNELYSQETAFRWNNGVRYESNYNAHFIATLRKDGKQAIFTSTNGKYTYEDCNYYGSYACPNGWASTTWGFEGFFLVNLAPVSGGVNDTPPNPPMIVE